MTLRYHYSYYLINRKEYGKAAAELQSWIDKHDASEGFDYINARRVCAKALALSGDYTAAWKAIEPVINSWQEATLLQAADILMYKGDFVPVGEDQVPHVELTREIARRFNLFYSKRNTVFPEPQPLLTPAAKLPGTDGRKMSKSYGNTIMLTDPEPVVRQKLKTMVTDPARVRRTDPGNPDVCPVGDLHKIFSDQGTMAKVNEGCRSAGIGCIECKSWAADALVSILNPMQERRKKYEDNPRVAWDILEAGSARAGRVADSTMREVREAMGMSLDYTVGNSAKGAE